MNKSEGLMSPVHPGEVHREDFMRPLGLTVNRLALELHVPATRIGEIVHERRRITAETALRLARYFRTNAEFWLNTFLTTRRCWEPTSNRLQVFRGNSHSLGKAQRPFAVRRWQARL